jgi:hypothetical protein
MILPSVHPHSFQCKEEPSVIAAIEEPEYLLTISPNILTSPEGFYFFKLNALASVISLFKQSTDVAD